MERDKFVDLFPSMYLSQNLRELPPYLPKFGVAYVDGITITQFTTVSSIEEAQDCADSITSLQADKDQDDDDSSFNTSYASPPAKKKLQFGNDKPELPAGQVQKKPTEQEADEDDVGSAKSPKLKTVEAPKHDEDKQIESDDYDEDGQELETTELMNKLGVETPTK